MSHKKITASHESNVVSLDDRRPAASSYVACLSCGKDWVAVHWPDGERFECPECGEMDGEIVAPMDTDFLSRFMNAAKNDKDAKRRTLVMLNAKRMIDAGVFN
ncbi:MAG: hypothetical protein ACO3J2_11005 [Chthoniobacterales bacterium]